MDTLATVDHTVLKETIAEATNGLLDIDTIKTAEELAAEEQAKRDEAIAAAVYAKPDHMIIHKFPDTFQVRVFR